MFRSSFRRKLPLPGLLLLAGALPLMSGAQQSGSQIEQHFLAAQQDQQQGLLDAAVREYQAVLRLQPALPEAYVNLGLVYYAQAKFEESSAALARAAKLRPGMPGVSLWLGIDNVKLNRPARGAALLREAIRQNPKDKLAQSWLGTALWNSGQTEAALLQLHKAATQFPSDPDILLACGEAYGKAASEETEQLLADSSGTALSDLIYGTIYAGEREWSRAEGHLQRAIKRDPNLLDARLELAKAFLEQARLDAAQEQLESAVALAPRSPAALACSGLSMLLNGRHHEGLARIQKALESGSSEALDALGLPADDHVSGGTPDAKFLQLCRNAQERLQADPASNSAKDVALAALHDRTGDLGAPLPYRLTGVAQSPPGSPVNLLAGALLAVHKHNYDLAEADLLRWMAANPGDHFARYQLSLVRRKISMSQLARLLAVAPDSYQVHQMLGQIYVRREEDDKALAEYQAVASAHPDLPGVHFWLGHLYWKHGDADRAHVEFVRELELDPLHPEANAELGAILVAQERAAEAIPHLESAIRIKPDLWLAYVDLGRAYAFEKNYTRAEEALQKSLPHDQDGSVYYQLGLALRAEGKTTQANQAFAKVRAIKAEAMTPFSNGDQEKEGARP